MAEAKALLPQHPWPAFAFDLELPDGSGVDLLEWARGHTSWKHTPAAVITASILLDDHTLSRIESARATLHGGVFTAPDIEAILRELMMS